MALKILLDTNTYSGLGKGNAHILKILQKADEIVVSTIVLGELYAGFSLGSRKTKNVAELEEFLKQPGISVVAPSQTIAERYGEVIRILRENGTPIPTNDVWIAATALETASRIFSLDTHSSLVPGVLTVL